MTRLSPTSFFNDVFPDRRDKEAGKYLCRFCGKPSVKPKKYYCSDECYWNCQRSVSWRFARKGTFNRDGGECVKCGKKLNYDNTWDCHHIIPVKELYNLSINTVYKNHHWDGLNTDKKNHGWAIIYTLLIHDINNLITLCPACHKREHATHPTPQIELEPLRTLNYFFENDGCA